jgi:lysophospholipase L1-like esterase
MSDLRLPHFSRYVALGDSSTEGLDDPDERGGFRGWANRLAERLAELQGSVLYANLAVRGRTTRQIREEQLETALAMRPDLATVFSGTNDVVGSTFDPDALARDVAEMQGALVGQGATVLTFTLPDLVPVMPMARLVASRVHRLNEVLRSVSRATGAVLVDIARYPVASDPRLWSEDRLHANALGHARIAAALAFALGLPESDDRWTHPLDPAPRRSWWERLTAELSWGKRYFLPWVWRSLRGQSSGDGQAPKRPALLPLSHPSERPFSVRP